MRPLRPVPDMAISSKVVQCYIYFITLTMNFYQSLRLGRMNTIAGHVVFYYLTFLTAKLMCGYLPVRDSASTLAIRILRKLWILTSFP